MIRPEDLPGVEVPSFEAGASELLPEQAIAEATKIEPFARRWTRRFESGKAFGLGPEDWLPVLAAEWEREIRRGGQGFSEIEALYAAQAVSGKGPGVLAPEPAPAPVLGLGGPVGRTLGAAREDLRAILQGLPQMPAAIVKEPIKALAVAAGEQVGHPALERAGFGELVRSLAPGQQFTRLMPGEAPPTGLAAAAEAPLLRFLPGWGTVLRIPTAKGRAEIARHPLLAVLDVAPWFTKALRPHIAEWAFRTAVPEKLSAWAMERGTLRLPWERPYKVLNRPLRDVVDQAVKATRSDTPLEDSIRVLHGLNDPRAFAEWASGMEFGERFTWGVLAERLRQAPFRRLRMTPEFRELVYRPAAVIHREMNDKIEEMLWLPEHLEHTMDLPKGELERRPELNRRFAELVSQSYIAYQNPEWIQAAIASRRGATAEGRAAARELVRTNVAEARRIATAEGVDLMADVVAGRRRVDLADAPPALRKIQELRDEMGARLYPVTEVGLATGKYMLLNLDELRDLGTGIGVGLEDLFLEGMYYRDAPWAETFGPWELYAGGPAPRGAAKAYRDLKFGRGSLAAESTRILGALVRLRSMLMEETDPAVIAAFLKKAHLDENLVARFSAQLLDESFDLGVLVPEALSPERREFWRGRFTKFRDKVAAEPAVRFYPLLRAYTHTMSGVPLENWYLIESEWLRANPGKSSADYQAAIASMQTWEREASRAWFALKEAGFSPMWVPQVSVGRPTARGIIPAPIPDRVSAPQHFMKNTLRVGRQFWHNVNVAVNDATIDVLRYQAGVKNIEGIERAFLHPIEDVYRDYGDAVQRSHPELSPGSEPFDLRVQEWIRRDFEDWEPDSWYTFRSPRVPRLDRPQLREGRYVIHKPVLTALRQLSPSGEPDIIPAIFDRGLMGLWRTSVLALRPSWNINNIIGGLVMLLGDSPGALRYLREGWHLSRALTEEDPGRRATMLAGIDPEKAPAALTRIGLRDLLGLIGPEQELMRTAYLEGRSYGRMVEGLARVTNPLYLFNERVDLMYRAAAFLEGRDRSLLGGMSRRDAVDVGLRKSYQVLQDWDAMSPIERAVFRRIFPFYGWAKHVLRYTLRQPFDHPLRTAILAKLGEIVVDGQDPTLSDRFNFGMFKLGDLAGRAYLLPFGAANPFADVARMATLGGFVSYFNPAIIGLLEAMGVDARTARGELYPGFEYDPERGRLRAVAPGFRQVAVDFFPQVSALNMVLGRLGIGTKEAQALARENPEAAAAMAASRIGLPFGVIPQAGVPLRQEHLGVERARQARAASEALTAALTRAGGGDLEPLTRYYSKREAEALIRFATALRIQSARAGQQAPAMDKILLAWNIARQRQAQGLQ